MYIDFNLTYTTIATSIETINDNIEMTKDIIFQSSLTKPGSSSGRGCRCGFSSHFLNFLDCLNRLKSLPFGLND